MPIKRLSRFAKFITGVLNEAATDANRFERFIHFWIFVGKSFARNRCFIRSSALSFSTLLALIPLLAVTISVSSSLLKSQGEQQIESFIQKFVNGVMPPATLETNAAESASASTNQIANTAAETNSMTKGGDRIVTAQKQVAQHIHEFIQKTRSATLGVVGTLMLVFVAIRMLASIEATFNDIWGVVRGRGWIASTILYWSVISLGTMLLVGAVGLAGGSRFHSAQHFIQQMPFIGWAIFHLLPFVVLWITFALVYQFVPNTRVHFTAAFVGALVSGTVWQLNNVFGFLYISRVVMNNKLYGSLGLLPVFMAGLYFSWLILLFGAQVSYAFQNRKMFSEQKLAENVNQRGREFIALRLMDAIGRRFQNGSQPATVLELADELKIPSKLVQIVLQTLVGSRLVVEVSGSDIGYAPARPLEAITAYDILSAMRAAGQDLPQSEPRAEVLGEFARIEEAERVAASKITLLALVHRDRKQIADTK